MAQFVAPEERLPDLQVPVVVLYRREPEGRLDWTILCWIGSGWITGPAGVAGSGDPFPWEVVLWLDFGGEVVAGEDSV